MSLCVLHTIVNSILGRSSGLPRVQHDLYLRYVNQAAGSSTSAGEMVFRAIFETCPFVDELERRGRNLGDSLSTERSLQRLQQWSKDLPEQLWKRSEISGPVLMSTDREMYIFENRQENI